MELQRRKFLGAMIATLAASAVVPLTGQAKGNSRPGRIIVDGLDTSVVNEEFLAMARSSEVDCIHISMGDFDSYGQMYRFIDEHSNRVRLATTVAGIKTAKADGVISLVLGSQHANFLEKTLVKGATGRYQPFVDTLRAYYELGLRIQGICYNVANVFGGGMLDPRVPLTRAGHKLVEEVHKLNMILDVGGHTGEQTSLDAIAASSGVPVICSHTNAAALNPNPRAITDRLIEAIASTGGVVGLTAISDFHVRNAESAKEHGPTSAAASLDKHLDQYDHLKRLVGVEHIGLGPDFPWGWNEGFNHQGEGSLTFPTEALGDGNVVLVEGWEDISQLHNVVNGLRGRGWSEKELDALLGGNWLRVYQKVWGA